MGVITRVFVQQSTSACNTPYYLIFCRGDLRKSLKKNREREKDKERDRSGSRKESEKTKDKDSGKKNLDGRLKDIKTKGNDKDRKDKDKEGSERKAKDKKQVSEKQDTSNEDCVKSSSRDSTRKQPQETKLRKSETTLEKRSRSNSESSKTPTSPPKTTKASPLSKPTNPPKTPPTPQKKSPTEKENERVLGEATEEKMDTLPPPRSPEQEPEGHETLGSISRLKDAPESASVPDTPESPPAPHPSKNDHKLESDLSSGEEFPESTAGSPLSPRAPTGEVRTEGPVKVPKNEQPGKREEGEPPVRFKMKVSRLRTGMLSPTGTQWSPDHHNSPPYSSSPPSKQTGSRRTPLAAAETTSIPASSQVSGVEELEEASGSRKSKKLPRCYQLEDERLREKQREPKEHRHTKQHPPPTTPSPPPTYASSSSLHRRRHAHSPPPPQQQQVAERGRWRQRGSRHFSPPTHFSSRRYSRSPPPGYPPSPPPPSHGGGVGGRSPYSSSPPRPRTPIQRPPRDRGSGGSRHRYDSPPYDIPPRGKHSRRGSSPVRHFSPSPPPPRPRSPGGPSARRHYQRRYSKSPSPPPIRRSPLRRKDPPRSPSPGSSRSSPRYPEDRLEPRKFSKKPSHTVYSRSPSPPKPKRRDGGPLREEYPDSKRRRVEDTRGVKSPTTSGTKDEPGKGSRPEKLQPSPYSLSSSDRHHGSMKESQQQRYQQGSGSVAHVGGTSHSSHHPNGQSKTATSPSASAAGSVPSKPTTLQQTQPQPPADNLLDLLRYTHITALSLGSPPCQ